MTEREHFINDYLTGDYSMSELCRRYRISRKTGYKWVDRYMARCELTDRSSKPHNSPRAVASWLEDAIVQWRKRRPRWGPRKLRQAMLRANPKADLPSVSTFALIIRRNGLVRPRRRRRYTPVHTAPLAHAKQPNAVWCIDFKGHFAVGTARCYPLTVTDAYSRYLLACVAVRRPDGKHVRRAMEAVFEEFGLPAAIRSDNGTPFASTGVAGLSQLSAWWWKLGIRHERIEPGKPQQNGRHERMHLTLQQETATPPRSSNRAQQRAFDHFRKDYNHDRPHQALGGNVPAEYYERSARLLPVPVWGKPFTYPAHFETATVSKLGYLQWNGRAAYLGTALAHETIGLDWRDQLGWDVYFGSMHLGSLRRGLRGGIRFIALEQPVTQVSATNRHQRP